MFFCLWITNCVYAAGKSSVKLAPPSSGGKNVIRVSLHREEVKLNQTKDAWKPTRLKNTNISEEEYKTQVRKALATRHRLFYQPVQLYYSVSSLFVLALSLVGLAIFFFIIAF